MSPIHSRTGVNNPKGSWLSAKALSQPHIQRRLPQLRQILLSGRQNVLGLRADQIRRRIPCVQILRPALSVLPVSAVIQNHRNVPCLLHRPVLHHDVILQALPGPVGMPCLLILRQLPAVILSVLSPAVFTIALFHMGRIEKNTVQPKHTHRFPKNRGRHLLIPVSAVRTGGHKKRPGSHSSASIADRISLRILHKPFRMLQINHVVGLTEIKPPDHMDSLLMTAADDLANQIAPRPEIFVSVMKGHPGLIPGVDPARIQHHGISSHPLYALRNLLWNHLFRILYLQVILYDPQILIPPFLSHCHTSIPIPSAMPP